MAAPLLMVVATAPVVCFVVAWLVTLPCSSKSVSESPTPSVACVLSDASVVVAIRSLDTVSLSIDAILELTVVVVSDTGDIVVVDPSGVVLETVVNVAVLELIPVLEDDVADVRVSLERLRTTVVLLTVDSVTETVLDTFVSVVGVAVIVVVNVLDVSVSVVDVIDDTVQLVVELVADVTVVPVFVAVAVEAVLVELAMVEVAVAVVVTEETAVEDTVVVVLVVCV